MKNNKIIYLVIFFVVATILLTLFITRGTNVGEPINSFPEERDLNYIKNYSTYFVEGLGINMTFDSNWGINTEQFHQEPVLTITEIFSNSGGKLSIISRQYSDSEVEEIELLRNKIKEGTASIDYTGGSLPQEKHLEDSLKYDTYIGEIDGWKLYRNSKDLDEVIGIAGRVDGTEQVTRDLGIFGHTNVLSSLHIQYEFDKDISPLEREKLIEEFDQIVLSMKPSQE